MAYPPLTPSWEELAQMRRRGQRPVGAVYLSTDRGYRERQWTNRGLYCLSPDGPAVLLAGLSVLMLAPKTPALIEYAQSIFAANPLRFQVKWEGESWQDVM